MTKNKMIQFALVAIGAGLCISGQSPSREIAETENYSQVLNEEQSEQSSAEVAEFDPDSDRKSAARRVIEGSSNTTVNGKRKSAAQRAMEG